MSDSRTRTLPKHYPNEKNPFHEDAAQSKSKRNTITRTFSKIKESVRRSFRKKPEKQLRYGVSESSGLEGAKQRCTASIETQEEFVIRTRIPDRCTAPPDQYTAHTITTPVPPPRTSSLRKRNRLNSTSSSCSRNPFEDDITPLFPDTRAAMISSSRHTLNIIPQHSDSQVFRSSQMNYPTLRTSCESICTIGGTRRKKRIAPLPPTHDTAIHTAPTVAMDNSEDAVELQRIQNDIKLMTHDMINRNKELLADLPATYSTIPNDRIDLDNSHSKPVQLETGNEYTEPENYISSEVILLTSSASPAPAQLDTPPIVHKFSTFQPNNISASETGMTEAENSTRLEDTRTAVTPDTRDHSLSDNDHIHNLYRDIAVDINSNEVGKPERPDYRSIMDATVREKCNYFETRMMKYIDDDRDDILEPNNQLGP